jgi:hypothetical protein
MKKSDTLTALFLSIATAATAACLAIPDLDEEETKVNKPSPLDGPKRAVETPLEKEPPPVRERAKGAASLGQESYGPEFLERETGIDRVLARVEGQQIRASDLFQIYFMVDPVQTRDVLENLIFYILVRKEAGRLGIRAGASEVETYLERLLKEQQNMIAAKVDEALSLERFIENQYGMSLEDYRELIRPTAVFQLLLERCVRYKELQARRLRLGVILLKDAAEAQKIHKKLEKGASFEVLAREHSVDPSGALGGGVLPPLPADMDFPIIEESINLKPGEITGVVEADLGKEKIYRIIKLIEIIEPLRGSYAELEDQVEESLKEEPLWHPEILRYWQRTMKRTYHVEYLMP